LSHFFAVCCSLECSSVFSTTRTPMVGGPELVACLLDWVKRTQWLESCVGENKARIKQKKESCEVQWFFYFYVYFYVYVQTKF
jgi:hypothetical protein